MVDSPSTASKPASKDGAAPAPQVLEVSRPQPGELRIVDVDHATDVSFEFGLEDGRFIALDVDVIIAFTDGAKLLLPNLGLLAAGMNPPNVRFAGRPMSWEQVLSSVTEVTISDATATIASVGRSSDAGKAQDDQSAQQASAVREGELQPAPLVRLQRSSVDAQDSEIQPAAAPGGSSTSVDYVPKFNSLGVGSALRTGTRDNDFTGYYNNSGLKVALGVTLFNSEYSTAKSLPGGGLDISGPLGGPGSASSNDFSYQTAARIPPAATGMADRVDLDGPAVAPATSKISTDLPAGWSARKVTLTLDSQTGGFAPKSVSLGLTVTTTDKPAEFGEYKIYSVNGKSPVSSTGSYEFDIDPDTPGQIQFYLYYKLPTDAAAASTDAFGLVEDYGLTVKVSTLSEDAKGNQLSNDSNIYFGVKQVASADDTQVDLPDHTVYVLWANPPGAVMDLGGGDDTVISSAGADSLTGGDGVDLVSYERSNSGIRLNMNVGVASAGGYARGDMFSDEFENVVATKFDDSILGNSRDNHVWSAGGRDTIDGGAGRDTVDYASSVDGVTVDLTSGASQHGGDAEGNVLTNIENVIGSATGPNVLTGNARDNRLVGGAADDVFYGSAGADTYVGGGGVNAVHYESYGADLSIDLTAGGLRFESIQALSGVADHANIFIGDGNAYFVQGGSKGDWLQGGALGDTFVGGDGADTFLASATGDSIIGGDDSGRDLIDYTNFISQEAGRLTINEFGAVFIRDGELTGDSRDNISGIEDFIGAKNVRNQILGSAQSNLITGGDLADTLVGGAGADTFSGLGGNDSIVGAADGDWVSYAYAAAGVSLDLAAGTAIVSSGDRDRIVAVANATGSAHDDTIAGNDAANSIAGGDGNDQLRGGGGNDFIDGGDGFENLDYSEGGAPVTASLSAGQSRVDAGSINGVDTIANIEQIMFGAGADYVTDAGSGMIIDAAGGVDTIDFSPASSVEVIASDAAGTIARISSGARSADSVLRNFERVIGSSGSDKLQFSDSLDHSIIGSGGFDTIVTGDGADTIAGGGGDSLVGGGGIDLLDYSGQERAISVSLNGANAATLAVTGAGQDLVSGFERVRASRAADTIFGDSGANTIVGGGGADSISGREGNDSLVGGDFSEGAWIDYSYVGAGAGVTLRLGATQQTVTVRADDVDVISGFANVVGSDGADSLLGDGNANRMIGRAGADTLDGGAGADTLAAGASPDAYVLSTSATQNWAASTGFSSPVSGANGFTFKYTVTPTTGTNAVGVAIGGATLFLGLNGDVYGVWQAGQPNSGFDSSGAKETMDGQSHTIAFDVAVTSASSIEVIMYRDGAVYGSKVTYNGLALGDQMLKQIQFVRQSTGTTWDDIALWGERFSTADLQRLSASPEEIGSRGPAVRFSFNNGVLNSSSNYEFVSEGSVSSTITLAPANVVLPGSSLIGGAGNDSLFGSTAADTLVGGAEDDTLLGGAGSDSILGDGGVDTVDYSYVTTGGAGVSLALNGTVVTGASVSAADIDRLVNIENVIGTIYSDTMSASDSVAHAFSGGQGADSIGGGYGADTLDGGANDDTVFYSHLAGVSVSVAGWSGQTAVINLLQGGTLVSQDTVVNFEKLIGSANNDTFLSNPATAETFDGGAGVDLVSYAGLTDAFSVALNGASPAAVLIGGAERNYLLNVERLVGGGGDDSIGGDTQANSFAGGQGADTLVGGAGNDTLDGGDGGDSLDGGAGNDLFIVDSSSDQVTDSGGVDQIRTSLSSMDLRVFGGGAIESVTYTGSGAFTGVGASSNNTIIGAGGDDSLIGGGGRDTLDGGGGADTLAAGASDSALLTGSTVNNVSSFANFVDATLSPSGIDITQSGGLRGFTLAFTMAAASISLRNFLGLTLSSPTGAGNYQLLFGSENPAGQIGVVSGGSASIGGFSTIYTDTAFHTYAYRLTSDGATYTDVALAYDGQVVWTMRFDKSQVGAQAFPQLGQYIQLLMPNIRGGAGAQWDDIRLWTGGLSDAALVLASKGILPNEGNLIANYQFSGENLYENKAGSAYAMTLAASDAVPGSIFYGGVGADSLVGSAAGDTLVGGSENDTFVGGSGSDSILGDGGVDTVDYSYVTTVGAGVVVALNGAGINGASVSATDMDRLVNIENVIGTIYSDTMSASDSVSHAFSGGLGNDSIGGGYGADTLDGGDASDTVFYSHLAGVSVSIASWSGQTAVINLLQGGNVVSQDTVINFERLIGDSNNDTFLSNPTSAETFDGGAGVDIFDSSSISTGVSVTLMAGATVSIGSNVLVNMEGLLLGAGDDTVTGDVSANWINASGGNNKVYTGGGADTVITGSGDDYIGPGGTLGLTTGQGGIYTPPALGSSWSVSIRFKTATNALPQLGLTGLGYRTFGYDGSSFVWPGGSSVTSAYDRTTYVRLTMTYDSDAKIAVLYGDDKAIQTATNVSLPTVGAYAFNVSDQNVNFDDISFFGAALTSQEVQGLDAAISSGSSLPSSAKAVWNFNNLINPYTDLVSVALLPASYATPGQSLSSGDGNDTIVGGVASDTIDGGTGADIMNGGGGNDLYLVDNLGDRVLDVAGAADAVISSVDIDVANISGIERFAFTWADGRRFTGADVAESVLGGTGADTLRALAGNDTLDGDGGVDLVDYSYVTAGDVGVSLTLNGTVATRASVSTADIDRLVNIENVIGTIYSDTMSASDSVAHAFSGGLGNDSIGGGYGADTLDGGDATDTVFYSHLAGVSVSIASWSGQTAFVNLLQGGNVVSQDTVVNFERLIGSANNDTFLSNPTSAETFDGGAGMDIFDSSSISTGVSVTLMTGATVSVGSNVLVNMEGLLLGTGDDSVVGDVATNRIETGGGADTIYTGGGADTVIAGAGHDYIGLGGALGLMTEQGGNFGAPALPVLGPSWSVSIRFKTATNALPQLGFSGVGYQSFGYDGTAFVGPSGLKSTEAYVQNTYVRLTVTYDSDTKIETLYVDGKQPVILTNVSLPTLSGYALNVSKQNVNFDDISFFGAALTSQEVQGLDVAISSGSSLPSSARAVWNFNDLTNPYADIVSGVLLPVSNGSPGQSLSGGEGNDTIVGGVANDTIDGGTDADVMNGGAGNDLYYVDSLGDRVLDVAGSDTVISSVDINVANISGIERFAFTGADGRRFTGSDAAETVLGGTGADTLLALAGNDSLDGDGGVDTVDYSYVTTGGAGVSLALNGTVATGASVSAADIDRLVNIENVIGSIYSDTIIASDSVAHAFPGGSGDDSIGGGFGADTLDGGDASDTVFYSHLAGVSVSIASWSGQTAVVNLLQGGTVVSQDTVVNFERLIGAANNDTFLSNPSAAETFDGGAGYDIFDSSSTSASVSVALTPGTTITVGSNALVNMEGLLLGAGDDTVTGDVSANWINAGGGNDKVFTGGGADTVIAGVGDDYIGPGGTLGLTSAQGNNYALTSNVGPSWTVSIKFKGANAGGNMNYQLATPNYDNFGYLFGKFYGIGNINVAGTYDPTQYVRLTETYDAVTQTAILYRDSQEIARKTGVTLSAISAMAINQQSANVNFDDIAFFSSALSATDVGVLNSTISNVTNVSQIDASWKPAYVWTFNDLTNPMADLTGAIYPAAFTSSGQSLSGGDGNDTIIGSVGADTISGGIGVNLIDGGGSSVDVLSFESVSSGGISLALTGGARTTFVVDAFETDIFSNIEGLIGTRFADTLIGDGNANALYGGDGADNLFGGLGNDTLAGGAGNDTIDGGGNYDVLTYADAAQGVSLTLNGAIVATAIFASGEQDQIVNIEGLIGSNFADTLSGDGAANTIAGGGGNDSILGAAGADDLDGGAGNDTVLGGAGADSLTGGAGNDSLDGGSDTSIDIVKYDYFTGGVTVDLSSSTATIAAGDIDTLANVEGVLGGAFNDSLAGDSRSNWLSGGIGNDTLFSGAGGADSLYGGTGNDLIRFASPTLGVIDGGANNDTLSFDISGAYSGAALSAAITGVETLDFSKAGVSASLSLSGAEVSKILGAKTGELWLYTNNADDTFTAGAFTSNTVVNTTRTDYTYTDTSGTSVVLHYVHT